MARRSPARTSSMPASSSRAVGRRAGLHRSWSAIGRSRRCSPATRRSPPCSGPLHQVALHRSAVRALEHDLPRLARAQRLLDVEGLGRRGESKRAVDAAVPIAPLESAAPLPLPLAARRIAAPDLEALLDTHGAA